MLTTTNAVKAQVIAALNAALGVLAAFNVASLTDTQKGALLAAVNVVFGLIVAVTYKSSVKRVPDPPAVAPVALPASVATASVTTEALQAELQRRSSVKPVS
jgi:hypothetical protein